MLTEPQKSVLINCAKYYRVSGDYYYEPGDGVSTRTLDALVKKGILDGEGRPFRYWLTDGGFKVRSDLEAVIADMESES